MNKAICVIALLIVVVLPACSSTKTLTGVSMNNAMDTTMGSYSAQNASELILVTMRNDQHIKLTQGRPITREENLPVPYASFLATLARKHNISRVADWPLSSLNIRCLVFKTNQKEQRDKIIAQLNKEPQIETAQALSLFKPMSTVYNDPYLKMQHGFKQMQAQASHQWATGKGIKVAVIDTGIDTHHLDLDQRLTGVKNFVDRSDRKFNNDLHGTAVASVIAATANNGTGMVGIAPEANILGLKACWQESTSDDGAYCNSFTLAKAINFAHQQNVDIINLSLTGPADPLLERLLQAAMNKNITVVGALHPTQKKQFPASVEGVIAVAEDSKRYRHIDNAVKAPGLKILSARPGNLYDFYSGSSLSTAHISGLVALIKQRKPHLSSETIHSLIKVTADKTSGAANACQTLAHLIGAKYCPEAIAATD